MPNRVSVLIPNLNGLTELKACIPSVLKQSGVEKEVVVVDNGSRDGSVDYLRALPSNKIVSNERNLGFAKAVNQAVNISTGETSSYMIRQTRSALRMRRFAINAPPIRGCRRLGVSATST